MKRSGKILVLALSALTVSTGARALTADSSVGPYHGIVERNIFDIHAALPPPPPDPNIGRPPPPTIKLQGITDILGRKQVLFKVQLPPKPPAPAKEESFILTIGERQGEIEVLDINPKAGTVKVNNYGVITNLSLEFNSDKLVNVAPVAAPAAAANPAQMTAPGSLAPPPSLPPTLPAGKFPRALRLPGSGLSNNAQPNAGVPNYGGGTGFGAASPSGLVDGYEPQPQMSQEARALLMEAQKLKFKNDGNPIHTIFPPTPGMP